MAKKVIYIADSLDNAHKLHEILMRMDTEVVAGSSRNFKRLILENPDCDLVIYEVRGDVASSIADAESILVEDGVGSLLLLLKREQLSGLRLPIQVNSDFVLQDASIEEFVARIGLILWPGNEATASEFITIDDMTINLATYQVKVGGEPLDLTYLEYALLAFLVTHPGRTYSRDTLLRRVWGFDYYGGSRTIDVHVRRVRAKLGPELAQRLETVRGVGYLWTT